MIYKSIILSLPCLAIVSCATRSVPVAQKSNSASGRSPASQPMGHAQPGGPGAGPNMRRQTNVKGPEAPAPGCPLFANEVMDRTLNISVADVLLKPQISVTFEGVPTFSGSIAGDRKILNDNIMRGNLDPEVLDAMRDSPVFGSAMQYLGLGTWDETPHSTVAKDMAGGARVAGILAVAIAMSKYPGCPEEVFKQGIRSFSGGALGKDGEMYQQQLTQMAKFFEEAHAAETSNRFDEQYAQIQDSWRNSDQELRNRQQDLDEKFRSDEEALRFLNEDIDASYKIFAKDLKQIKYCDETVFRGAFSTVPKVGAKKRFESMLDRCTTALTRDIDHLATAIEFREESKTSRKAKDREQASLRKRQAKLQKYLDALSNNRDALVTQIEKIEEMAEQKQEMHSKNYYASEQKAVAVARNAVQKDSGRYIMFSLYAQAQPEDLGLDPNLRGRADD